MTKNGVKDELKTMEQTTWWLQGRLSLSSFQGQSSEYQEFLRT